jgi:hypothetical protein
MTSHPKRPRDPLAPDAGSAAPSATASDALEALSLGAGCHVPDNSGHRMACFAARHENHFVELMKRS